MDVTLDDVQNELREPRYSDHDFAGSETASQANYGYKAWQTTNEDLSRRAYKHFSDAKRREKLLKQYGSACLLVLGTTVVGHGRTFTQAAEEGRKRYFDAMDCWVSFLEPVDGLF